MLSSLLLPEQACFFKLSKLSWLNKLETVKTHASLLYIRIKMHALNLLSVWMPSPSTLWLKLKYFTLDIQILYLIKMRKPRNSVSLVKRQTSTPLYWHKVFIASKQFELISRLIWYFHGILIYMFVKFQKSFKFLKDSREDVRLHRTNLKYFAKSPKIWFHSHSHIL